MKGKSVLIVFLVLFFVLAALAFSPVRVGTIRDFRIFVTLKYWKILPVELKSAPAIIAALESTDPRVQVDAAQSVGFLTPDPETALALRRFLDRHDVEVSVKDVAIWSLGEIRNREALFQLRDRQSRPEYDQENLRLAIDKIEGRVERGWLPE